MANKLSKLIAKASTSDYPMVSSSKPSRAQQDEQRRYKAEDALRTITKATEIQRDRALMSDVKQIAKEQMKTLACVAQPRKK